MITSGIILKSLKFFQRNLALLKFQWLICGNKMPTRCNRGFYCRSYWLLNIFRAPLCPSSGAQEYYTVVAVCGISCYGFQVTGLVWSWGLCVRFTGCCSIQLLVWCGAEGYVSGLQDAAASSCWSGVELRVMCPVCRMLQHPANRTHNPQLHTRPATWKTTARNTTGSNHCIILLSSWWWV